MSALCCAKTLSATISSSWGKSSIMIRELSLGGGMGTKEDNLRVGSEATSRLPGRPPRAGEVLLRRARVNEVGFEIVNTDLGEPLPPAPHPDGFSGKFVRDHGRRVGRTAPGVSQCKRERPARAAAARVRQHERDARATKTKSLCAKQRLFIFAERCYFTFTMMMASV